MMDEDHPSEEYEEIDLDPSGMPLLPGSPAHGAAPIGVVSATVSPSRRPPMPLPGSAPPISGVY